MGFAARAKAELARVIPASRCCQEAELAGFAQASPSPAEPGRVVAETRSSAIARKLLVLGRERFGWVTRVEGVRGPARRVYRLELEPGDGPGWSELKRWRLRRRRASCCRRSFLRGAFLASGYVVEPHKGYHLEWVLPDGDVASRVVAMLADEGIPAGVATRKGLPVVYVKEADAIAAVLAAIGAHHAVLEFEDVRVLKGMRNRVNRLVNAETANVDKMVAAALRQGEAIRALQEVVGLDRLPPGLRAVAEARLAFPYASLKELGERLDPPLSKSAVGHRMRRLMELARSLAPEAGAGGIDAGDGEDRQDHQEGIGAGRGKLP